MNIEDLINKFMDMLWFVSYIKEENVKIQRFLSCLSQHYKDRIEFENPKTLHKFLIKERLCFEKYKQRNEQVWKDKERENFNHRKKGFQPSPFRNVTRNLQGNSYKRNEQFPQKNNKPVNLGPKGTVRAPKEPLTCWECGEAHLRRNWEFFNQSNKVFHKLQEASTIGEVLARFSS